MTQKEVLKLSQQAASILTPIRPNNVVQNNYLELISSAAKKMNWKTTELDRRCVGNSLFKSKDCNKAKTLLETFQEMDENFVKV